MKTVHKAILDMAPRQLGRTLAFLVLVPGVVHAESSLIGTTPHVERRLVEAPCQAVGDPSPNDPSSNDPSSNNPSSNRPARNDPAGEIIVMRWSASTA